jgi:hypothetical protein
MATEGSSTPQTPQENFFHSQSTIAGPALRDCCLCLRQSSTNRRPAKAASRWQRREAAPRRRPKRTSSTRNQRSLAERYAIVAFASGKAAQTVAPRKPPLNSNGGKQHPADAPRELLPLAINDRWPSATRLLPLPPAKQHKPSPRESRLSIATEGSSTPQTPQENFFHSQSTIAGPALRDCCLCLRQSSTNRRPAKAASRWQRREAAPRRRPKRTSSTRNQRSLAQRYATVAFASGKAAQTVAPRKPPLDGNGGKQHPADAPRELLPLAINDRWPSATRLLPLPPAKRHKPSPRESRLSMATEGSSTPQTPQENFFHSQSTIAGQALRDCCLCLRQSSTNRRPPKAASRW